MPIKKVKKVKTIRKNISEENVKKTQAFKLGKGVYKDKDKFEIDTNIKTGAGWALVHDGVKVHAVIEHTVGLHTGSIRDIEDFRTEKKCLDQIKKLGLKYNPPEPAPLVKQKVKIKASCILKLRSF